MNNDNIIELITIRLKEVQQVIKFHGEEGAYYSRKNDGNGMAIHSQLSHAYNKLESELQNLLSSYQQ